MERRDGPVWVIRTCQDVTEQRGALAALAGQVTRDPLTGVLSRFAIEDHLGHALNRLRRHDGELAVIFVDVDGLKDLNDTFGHGAGDRALRSVGERLRESVRLGDSVGRYGGDEFVVVCEDLRVPEEALIIAGRVARRVCGPGPDGRSGDRVTTSIGVTSALPAEPPASVIARADEAMYQAKREGGGRVVFRAPPNLR